MEKFKIVTLLETNGKYCYDQNGSWCRFIMDIDGELPYSQMCLVFSLWLLKLPDTINLLRCKQCLKEQHVDNFSIVNPPVDMTIYLDSNNIQHFISTEYYCYTLGDHNIQTLTGCRITDYTPGGLLYDNKNPITVTLRYDLPQLEK